MIAIPPTARPRLKRPADRRRRVSAGRPRREPLVWAGLALGLPPGLLFASGPGLWWALAGGVVLLALLLVLAHERQARLRAEREARSDALTGLLNRRGLDEALHAALARQGAPLSVLVFDLDHFKRVNDRFGHLTGDAVLREVAALLRANLRGGDLLGRWGGEEFVVLLPGVPACTAHAIAERLRTRLLAQVSVRGEPITASVGVSSATGEDSALSLLARADAALYAAKRAGRNRTVLEGEAA